MLLGADGLIPSDLIQNLTPIKSIGSFSALYSSFNNVVRSLYSSAKSGDGVILTVHRTDGLDILFIGTISSLSVTVVSINGWGILKDNDGVKILSNVFSHMMSGSRVTYYGTNDNDTTYTLEDGEGDVKYSGCALVFSI